MCRHLSYSILVMRSHLLPTAALLFTLAFSGASASAQAPSFASNGHYAMAGPDTTRPAAGTSSGPETKELVVLSGKITNPTGPLPGAVVILKGSNKMAVTNADGEFSFEVPASAGALQAVVTYAGFADENIVLNASENESTVNMANARVIKVSRKNQLKKYLKTAHKQVKRELKKVRN